MRKNCTKKLRHFSLMGKNFRSWICNSENNKSNFFCQFFTQYSMIFNNFLFHIFSQLLYIFPKFSSFLMIFFIQISMIFNEFEKQKYILEKQKKHFFWYRFNYLTRLHPFIQFIFSNLVSKHNVFLGIARFSFKMWLRATHPNL